MEKGNARLETAESHNARLIGRIDPPVKSISTVIYNATTHKVLQKLIDRLKEEIAKNDVKEIYSQAFIRGLWCAIDEANKLMKETW